MGVVGFLYVLLLSAVQPGFIPQFEVIQPDQGGGQNKTSLPGEPGELSYNVLNVGPVAFNLYGLPVIPESVNLTCVSDLSVPSLLNFNFASQGYDLLRSVRTYGVYSVNGWVDVVPSVIGGNGTMSIGFPLDVFPQLRASYVCAHLEKSIDPLGEPLYVCGALYCSNEPVLGVQVGNGADPVRNIPGGYIPNGNPLMTSGQGGITPQRGISTPGLGLSGEGGGPCGTLRGKPAQSSSLLALLVLIAASLLWMRRARAL